MGDDDKPAEKPTVAIPVVPSWAIDLKMSVDSGFRAVHQEIDTFKAEMRTDLDAVKNEGQRTNLRLTRMEMRQDDVETRLTHNSIRAASTSKVDEEQNAKLAEAHVALADEKARREVLEKNAASKEDVEKVLAENKLQTAELKAQTVTMNRILGDPKVKVVIGSLLGLLGAASVLGTLLVNQRIAALQHQPAPAPQVVYVVTPDGGK